MLTLYDFLFSGNGYRVRLALRELDVPFTYRQVDLLAGDTRKAWFLEKNPAGQIPVLELEDGTCIAESSAILFFLSEGTHLLPSEKLPRTRVLQWLCFEQTNVDGVISRARFRRTFPDVIATRPDEFTAWLHEGTRTLRVLDEHLRSRAFMVGGLAHDRRLGALFVCASCGRWGVRFEPVDGTPALVRQDRGAAAAHRDRHRAVRLSMLSDWAMLN